MSSKTIVAAFDFDHTLTCYESFLPFIRFVEGEVSTWSRLPLLFPLFLRFLMGGASREKVKEALLTLFFKGRALSDLEALGAIYAAQRLDRSLKPPALERLYWHQAQGHRCLLVSASLEFYLKPWGARHNFEAVLASRLEVTPDGKLTGRLAGPNCWGPEKVRRLESYLGPKSGYQLYAYGDSRGDQELLAFADFPYYRIYC